MKHENAQSDDWMTGEHEQAALEGFLGNPLALAYAQRYNEDQKDCKNGAGAWCCCKPDQP